MSGGPAGGGMSGGGTGLMSGGGLSMGSGGRGIVGLDGCSIMSSSVCKTLACGGRHVGRPLRTAARMGSDKGTRVGADPRVRPSHIQTDRAHQRQRVAVLDDARAQAVVERHAAVLESILEMHVDGVAAERGRELGERQI